MDPLKPAEPEKTSFSGCFWVLAAAVVGVFLVAFGIAIPLAGGPPVLAYIFFAAALAAWVYAFRRGKRGIDRKIEGGQGR